MNELKNILGITFVGGRRDKVFLTLVIISVLFFLAIVPSVSALSMRQVREVASGLSLSIISFISLVLTIFLGVNLVYRDIERKFVNTVLSLPVSRESYILGKFLGLSSIIAAAMLILSFFASAGIVIASAIHKSQGTMPWSTFALAVFFEYMSLLVIASFSIFFSSFSTNMFLPLFATIAVYVIGNVTQPVMDYITGPYGQKLPAISIYVSKAVYYIFPNLSAFDMKFKAIYSLPIALKDVFSVFSYAVIYTVIIISFSVLIFRKRDML